MAIAGDDLGVDGWCMPYPPPRQVAAEILARARIITTPASGGQRDMVVCTRLDPTERRALRRLAARYGVSVSMLLRIAILALEELDTLAEQGEW